jgi:hypothetical protein
MHNHIPRKPDRHAALPTLASAMLATLTACGGGGKGGGAIGGNNPGNPPVPVTFKISSPEVDLQSGQEIAWCYYFRLPTTAELFIKQWNATFTPGVERIVLHLVPVATRDDGTMSAIECQVAGGALGVAPMSTWAFTATASGDEFKFPDNDGTGKPVGLRATAGQPAMLWIHMFNPTVNVIRPHVEVTGATYAPGTTVTRADSFTTFIPSLGLQAMSEKTNTASCSTPVGARIFSMTTHTNRLAKAVSISTADPNGGAPINLFEKSFANTPGSLVPGVKRFSAPGFATFTNDQMTWSCTHLNNTDRVVTVGESVVFNESCTAVMLTFPATEARGCYGNITLP